MRGGTIVSSSDAIGGYPTTDAMRPEIMAATIYDSIGIQRTATWKDELDRRHHIYFGKPNRALT